MKNPILNEKPIDVFFILAETLDKWQSPNTPEGHSVLMEHYQWAAELKEMNKIILAGPTNLDLTASSATNPIGLITGLILLNANSREEATAWAEIDPFHLHGFRKNTVHSMKISISENSIFETLKTLDQTT